MDANTVGAVAALTGVSVRTLHHYDHIGLVVPSVRTPAGYRGYTDADIERLHLVLVYRAVGLPLDEIRALLDDASADVVERVSKLTGQHRQSVDSATACNHPPGGSPLPRRSTAPRAVDALSAAFGPWHG
jgi:DNA-binding transcriptional MerR regulator